MSDEKELERHMLARGFTPHVCTWTREKPCDHPQFHGSDDGFYERGSAPLDSEEYRADRGETEGDYRLAVEGWR